MISEVLLIVKKRLYRLLLIILFILCFLLFHKRISYSNIKKDMFTSYTYIPSALYSQKLNIAMMVVSDVKGQEKYKEYTENLSCYAKRHGYTFVILDPKSDLICSRIGDFFFQKHCTVRNYMISMSNLHWLLVLDGDTFVFNSSILIEEYIPNDKNIHVIHYERFYTGEIAAGIYLIRNHPWSHSYLKTWVNFHSKIPKQGYHNHDNGALHMVFLQMIGKDSVTLSKCYAAYLQSINEWKYYEYLRCCRCSIGGQRVFEHIQLLRRGHGFARDFSIPFSNDFILHGYKNNLSKYFYHPNKCTNDWLSNIRQDLFISDINIAKNLTRIKDQYSMQKYSRSLGIPDITDCWPNCEPEITGEKLAKYLQALC